MIGFQKESSAKVLNSIAIIMTVHNRREKTLRCLNCLYGQKLNFEHFSITVYMTDDGCTDGTREAVSERYPDVRIIDGDGTLFWNMGMRKAWEAAALDGGYDYYLWLNDDTYLNPTAMESMLSASLQYNEEAIIVGSTSASDDENCITYGGWSREGLITDVSKPILCHTFNGNIVLVPRYVFDRLGLNTTIFRHCGGDIEYGMRARRNGIGVWTVAGPQGVCDLHPNIPLWKDPSVPFRKRWNNFISPLGANPFEFFRFRKQYYGLFPACFTFITNMIHVMFPGLFIWGRSN